METEKNIENIIQKPEIIGSLFDNINYTSNEQLDIFIDNMTEEQALFCLKLAIQSCHLRGAFTLEESESVSKALRIITK